MVVIGIILLVITVIILMSYLIYRRPFLYTLAHFYFVCVSFNKMFKKGTYELEIQKRIRHPQARFPKIATRSKQNKILVNDKEVYELCKNNNYNKIIIYVHGGGFMDEITKYHVKLLDKIAVKTNSKIVIPCYDLVMNGNYKNAMELMSQLYLSIINECKDVYIMGDSAGGEIVLSFAQYIEKMGYSSPKKMILLSPWADLSLSNPQIKDYLDKDPVLAPYGLLRNAEKWSDGENLKSPTISPIYGNFANLPETLLITGDAEIFYPDMVILKNKFKESNTKIKFIVGHNQHHIYPVYPLMDITGVKREIIDFILK